LRCRVDTLTPLAQVRPIMKSVSYSRYGAPQELSISDRPTPEPKPNEILVRVLAVSLNASDVELLRGTPAYTRIWGLTAPRCHVLGSDCAGQVEAVGAKVTRFRPGDLVLGDLLEHWGALANFVSAPEKCWIGLPNGLSPEVACMLPQAGVVAWQAVSTTGSLENKRVLIVGAGGGSGTLAIQMANMLGAREVIAVDRGAKRAKLLELGATRFVDFEGEDYTRTINGCDLAVDLVGARSISDNARVLGATGHYALVGGPVRRLLGVLILGTLRSWLTRKVFRLLMVRQSPEAIEHVAKLCLDGAIQPILGARYTLDQTPDAFRALIEGKVIGKAVIAVDQR
jgi:NADPH:quinone reductase-like Zn-dependent oxidoreductase